MIHQAKCQRRRDIRKAEGLRPECVCELPGDLLYNLPAIRTFTYGSKLVDWKGQRSRVWPPEPGQEEA